MTEALAEGRDALVEISDLSKTYVTRGGEIRALDSTTLDVRRGEFLSVVGPSGCGKSTLLGIIAGLISPTHGTVTINGEQVREPYTNLGIAFQSPVLLDWRTTLDNVMLQVEMRGHRRRSATARDYERKALQLLGSLGLEGFGHRYPRELSGGMRQRVSTARALIHDPPLLLMDEPFSAVDALTRDQLVVDLQDLWLSRGVDLTIIFVTHHIEEAVFLGDRLLVMTPRPGQIAAILDIDYPRPRRLSDRAGDTLVGYGREVRELFLEHGVLHEGPYTQGAAE